VTVTDDVEEAIRLITDYRQRVNPPAARSKELA